MFPLPFLWNILTTTINRPNFLYIHFFIFKKKDLYNMRVNKKNLIWLNYIFKFGVVSCESLYIKQLHMYISWSIA